MMKAILIRAAKVLAALLLVGAALFSIEYFGGQPMGLFAGKRPAGLGYTAGKFAAPSWKPNTVSSTVDISDTTHYIAPISLGNDPAATWQKLLAHIKQSPRVSVVTEQPAYLYAEYKSAGLGFVDDVEFALDAAAGKIQVRSSSRLGVRDFGVNRARIEATRTALASK